MDEVIADAVAEHLLRYNRDHDEQITKKDLHGKWLWDVVALDRHPALEEYLRSEDFFAVLDVMPESQRVIQALQQEVRGVYRDGCDGGAHVVCREVCLAGAAFSVYSSVAHCVLRGQGDSAGGLPDRR